MPLLANKSDSYELVTMVTLDTFSESESDLLSNIDFIKIDTEGFEMNVLNGGLNYIKKVSPKFIQLEINWHQLFVNSTIFSFSELLNDYEVFKILPSGGCLYPISPSDPVNNIFQLTNVMFVRKNLALKIRSGDQ
jgi:hypothetical protein